MLSVIEMKIIEATEKELHSIVDLNCEVQNMHIKWYPEKYKKIDKKKLQEFLKESIKRKDTIYFVAKEDKKIVGYMKLVLFNREENIFMRKQSFIEIDQISISKKYRGKGIGKLLVEKAKEYATEHKINNLILTVKSENINAINAYKALGFKKTTERMEIDLNT